MSFVLICTHNYVLLTYNLQYMYMYMYILDCMIALIKFHNKLINR